MRYIISYQLIKESVSEAKSFWSKRFPDIDNFFLPYLQKILHKNPGYIGPFLKLIVKQESNNRSSSSTTQQDIIDHYNHISSIDKDTPGFISDYRPITELKLIYPKLVKYKQLFSNIKIDSFETFEQLDDYIENTIIKQKDISFVKQFISSKYQHLINDDTIALFVKLRDDLKISDRETINELIIKKIAAYQTSEEFNKHILDTIKQIEGNETDKIVLNIEETGCNLILNSDNIIICEVPTYQAMEQIGSPSWCIKRQKSYWDQYLLTSGVKLNMQYIIWNLDLETTDPDRMIGVTIDNDNSIYAAHDFNDNKVQDFELEDYRKYLKPMTLDQFIHCDINRNKWNRVDFFSNLFVFSDESVKPFIDGGWEIPTLYNTNIDGAYDLFDFCLKNTTSLNDEHFIRIMYILLHDYEFGRILQLINKFKNNLDLEGSINLLLPNQDSDECRKYLKYILDNPTFSPMKQEVVDTLTKSNPNNLDLIISYPSIQKQLEYISGLDITDILIGIMSRSDNKYSTIDKIAELSNYSFEFRNCRLLELTIRKGLKNGFKYVFNKPHVIETIENGDLNEMFSKHFNVIIDERVKHGETINDDLESLKLYMKHFDVVLNSYSLHKLTPYLTRTRDKELIELFSKNTSVKYYFKMTEEEFLKTYAKNL